MYNLLLNNAICSSYFLNWHFSICLSNVLNVFNKIGQLKKCLDVNTAPCFFTFCVFLIQSMVFP